MKILLKQDAVEVARIRLRFHMALAAPGEKPFQYARLAAVP